MNESNTVSLAAFKDAIHTIDLRERRIKDLKDERDDYKRCMDAAHIELRDLEERLRKSEADNEDLNATFELRHKADMRAIARWRESHPDKPLTMPDHADLVIWLEDRLQAVEKALAPHTVMHKYDELLKAHPYYKKFIDGTPFENDCGTLAWNTIHQLLHPTLKLPQPTQ